MRAPPNSDRARRAHRGAAGVRTRGSICRRCSRAWANSRRTRCWWRPVPTLAGELLARALVDELLLYVAPRLLGPDARALVELPRLAELDAGAAVHARRDAADRCGCAPAAAPAARPRRMFTGSSRTSAASKRARAAAATCAWPSLRAPGRRRRCASATASACRAVALPLPRSRGGSFAADVSRETLALTTLGRAAPPVRRSISSRRCGPAMPSAATWCPGTSTGSARCWRAARMHARGASPWGCPRRWRASSRPRARSRWTA